MMEFILAVLVFFGITLGLVTMPLVPHLTEWRKKTDAKHLRVVREFEVDIRHFAQGFRSYIESHLKPILDACSETGDTIEGALGDRTRYVVVPNDKAPLLTKFEERAHSSERMILSLEDLDLPEKTMYALEIYARGSVRGGEKSIYRAILAWDRIRLGDESISLRWLHAGTVVCARPGCILYGRVSADGGILLADDCRFERLNAPRIEFGSALETGDKEPSKNNTHQVTLLKPEELPGVVEVAAGRWLVDRKLEIPPNKLVETDLVVTKQTRIREGTRITGSIKSRANLNVEGDVDIEGNVISGQNLRIGEKCRIRGTVLAEGDVFIEKGVVIGTPERPTTVSARGIYITSGVVAHGTVWAHRDGQVRSLDEVVKNSRRSDFKKT